MHNLIERLSVVLRGAAAGILGTGLMTLVFILLDRAVAGEQTIAPSQPERLVGRVAERTGLTAVAAPETRGEAATLAHFSYGALWGGFYALADLFVPVSTLVGGAILGLFVWAISFIGWLPAIRHLPPPWRRPPSKVAAGLISHLAYGLGTAFAYHFLASPAGQAAEVSAHHPGMARATRTAIMTGDRSDEQRN